MMQKNMKNENEYNKKYLKSLLFQSNPADRYLRYFFDSMSQEQRALDLAVKLMGPSRSKDLSQVIAMEQYKKIVSPAHGDDHAVSTWFFSTHEEERSRISTSLIEKIYPLIPKSNLSETLFQPSPSLFQPSPKRIKMIGEPYSPFG
jgi:hypothetical protein